MQIELEEIANKIFKVESDNNLIYHVVEFQEVLKLLDGKIKTEEEQEVLNIQKSIRVFSIKTFPDSTAASKFNHLAKEILELLAAMEDERCGDIDIADEIADCMILLFDIAGSFGIDALGQVLVKHKINLSRKWGKPDEFGVVEHIKEME
jgi:NTP pyrophosphatase (non-canonical NTP hydrolase)